LKLFIWILGLLVGFKWLILVQIKEVHLMSEDNG